MPRTKPSDTIVYRIELGGKEREMVEEFLDSQKAANYAASGSNIASSITGGFKDIVSPLTSLSATSGVVFGAILASISVYLLDIAGNSDEDNKNKGAGAGLYYILFGRHLQGLDSPKTEEAVAWVRKWGLVLGTWGQSLEEKK